MRLPISRTAGAGGNKVSIPFVYRDRFLLCPGVLAVWESRHPDGGLRASIPFVYHNLALLCPGVLAGVRRNHLSALVTAPFCARRSRRGSSQPPFGSRDRSLVCPGVLAGVRRNRLSAESTTNTSHMGSRRLGGYRSQSPFGGIDDKYIQSWMRSVTFLMSSRNRLSAESTINTLTIMGEKKISQECRNRLSAESTINTWN